MKVKLRKVGNSNTLTVPSEIKVTGEEYNVKNIGATIVFSPIEKRKNIFSTHDWKEYDYQKDIEKDQALQSVEPVGREVID